VAIAFQGGILGSFNPLVLGLGMLVALITIGPGFIFHELSHKFVARRFGFWAEFRMWPQMLAMAIFISLTGFFFAAPGATYISGTDISETKNGVISLAGPLTNAAIALFFAPVFFFGGGMILRYIGGFGLWVNVELAAFNMIPFGPLDGAKVFRWNKAIWAVTLGVLLVSGVLVYQMIVPVIFR
jgi:Zn-dependent protease